MLSDELRFQAEMNFLWETGRYATARRRWRREGRLHASPDVVRERVGACLWEQGRYLPAVAWLWWASHRCDNPEAKLAILETTGRTIEHMARSPDTRILARPLARRLLRRLPPVAPGDGIDTYRRIEDLRSSLLQCTGTRRRAVDTAAESSMWFEQVGSLSGTVSFRHRNLRDSLGSQGDATSLSNAYRHQQALALAIGSTAGAMRVAFLPEAAQVFSRSEVREAINELELCRWHRFRLSSADLLFRARHRTVPR
jgi:hypothetical protein